MNDNDIRNANIALEDIADVKASAESVLRRKLGAVRKFLKDLNDYTYGLQCELNSHNGDPASEIPDGLEDELHRRKTEIKTLLGIDEALCQILKGFARIERIPAEISYKDE